MSTLQSNKRTEWAWTMYDWANSVFSLTIATAIFPPYFEAISKSAAIAAGNVHGGNHYIQLFGFNFINTALYSYALSFSFLLIAILSPILSGIADARGNKKMFLKFFCYLGASSSLLLFFIDQSNVLIGLMLFVLSLVGFTGSLVFYNAFLPEVTHEENYDQLSAKGYAMGYIGSVILLIANLVTILFPEWFFPVLEKQRIYMASGMSELDAFTAAKGYYEGLASRISFLTVGVWWAGFAQIPFAILQDKKPVQQPSEGVFKKGIQELKLVWIEINTNNEHNRVKRFLWGFFFTSMGLQTVMYVASIFGAQELNLPTQDLIITVLIIQLIAIIGAYLFAKLSGKIGNIYTLAITVVLWIVICFIAYGIHTALEFYILGALVGIVMGGIQSLFRSTYAKIIPDNTMRAASYFSFYDVCEKIGVVLGTLSFGLLLDMTGNMRNSVLALALYFIFGLFFIVRIKNFKTLHP
jgi:UMF1 family MFS transporter